MRVVLFLLLFIHIAPLSKLYSSKSPQKRSYKPLNTLAIPSQTSKMVIHGLERQSLASLHQSTVGELRESIWHFKNQLIQNSLVIIEDAKAKHDDGEYTEYLPYKHLVDNLKVARQSTPDFQEKALLCKTGVPPVNSNQNNIEFSVDVTGYKNKTFHANSYDERYLLTQCPTPETSYDFFHILRSQERHQDTSPEHPLLVINLTHPRENKSHNLPDNQPYYPGAFDYWPMPENPVTHSFSPHDDENLGPRITPPTITVSASWTKKTSSNVTRLEVQNNPSNSPTKYALSENQTEPMDITNTVMLEVTDSAAASEIRHIKMLRFENWPDGALPGVATNPQRDNDPQALLWNGEHYGNGLRNSDYQIPEHFFELVNTILWHQQQNPEQKICMHCSKGIGRTGVLALILHLEQQIAKELLQGTSIEDLTPNIPQAVRDLRARRFGSIGMQDNKDKQGNYDKRYSTQLEFIYFWIQHRQKVHEMLEFIKSSQGQNYQAFKEHYQQLSPHEQQSVLVLSLINHDQLEGNRDILGFIDEKAQQHFNREA